MLSLNLPSPIQLLTHPIFDAHQLTVHIKRDDLIDPNISGNKWRKLKYNLQAAQQQNCNALASFGGAYSNHLRAVAAAGAGLGLATFGFVRGEPSAIINQNLRFCQQAGMTLFYIDRATYRQKYYPDVFSQLQAQIPENFNPYWLPDGGSNHYAVKGCAELIPEITQQLGFCPNYFVCPVGTGGTLAGLATALDGHQSATRALGIAVLNDSSYLKSLVDALLLGYNNKGCDFTIFDQFTFGGYAKTNDELLNFMRLFEETYAIPLDFVYSGKMVYGVLQLAQQGYFAKNSSLVLLHTGGYANAGL